MTPKEDALHAIDRALGLMPKDGAATALDTNLLRYSLGHARQAVEKIDELKKKRAKPKAAKGPAAP